MRPYFLILGTFFLLLGGFLLYEKIANWHGHGEGQNVYIAPLTIAFGCFVLAFPIWKK